MGAVPRPWRRCPRAPADRVVPVSDGTKKTAASRSLARAASFIASFDVGVAAFANESWKAALVVLTREGQLTIYDSDRVKPAGRPNEDGFVRVSCASANQTGTATDAHSFLCAFAHSQKSPASSTGRLKSVHFSKAIVTVPLAQLERGAIQTLHESVAGRRYACVLVGCTQV